MVKELCCSSEGVFHRERFSMLSLTCDSSPVCYNQLSLMSCLKAAKEGEQSTRKRDKRRGTGLSLTSQTSLPPFQKEVFLSQTATDVEKQSREYSPEMHQLSLDILELKYIGRTAEITRTSDNKSKPNKSCS